MIRVKGYWIVNGHKSEFHECDFLSESADMARFEIMLEINNDNYIAGVDEVLNKYHIMLCTTTDLYGEGEVK